MAELKQLDIQEVLKPVNRQSLSKEEKEMTLHYLMFLKEKRIGKIKEEDVRTVENRERSLVRNMLHL